MTREENPRDRLFNPEPDTSDYRDRTEFGPEPVDETEDTVRDPEAHRPAPADEDRETSEEIAEEGARADATGADDPAASGRPGEMPTEETGEAGRSDVPDRSPVESARDETASAEAAHVSPSAETSDEGPSPAPVSVGVEGGRAPAPGAGEAGVLDDTNRDGPLLPASDADQMRTRWHELQAGFVDDPRRAVDEAAQLVSQATDRITSALKDRLGALDEGRSAGLGAGDESATEQLRTLMQRYHVLLDRLLAV
jgi:hypothetical protein